MMIKRLFAAALACTTPSTGFGAVCWLSTAQTPPAQWAAGPNVWASHVANPAVGGDIIAAQDAWNVTDAAGRLLGWSGRHLI